MREFPAPSFLVGLSSIHWREAWKYGERAFRYCQHDAGHAIGALRIAAATLGWSATLLHGLADETIEDLLGLNRAEDFAGAEREHPAAVLAVWPADSAQRVHAAAARSGPRAPTDSGVLAWCREPAQPRRAGALGGHRRSRRRDAQTGQRGASVRRARSAGGRGQRPRKRRRPRGRTDHPAAAQPAGLRRPDVDRSRTLLPHARAGDAARRAASQPAPDALGHAWPGIRPSTSVCSCIGSTASNPGCTCSFATRRKMDSLKRAMHQQLRLDAASRLPGRLAAAPARGRRRAGGSRRSSAATRPSPATAPSRSP